MSLDTGCPLESPNRHSLLRWTRHLISTLGLHPKDSLGQNFLVDPRGINMFVESLGGYKGLDLLEVGCGLGILTVSNAQHAGRIICIELDAGLAVAASHTAIKCGLSDKIQIVRGDGLAGVRAARLPIVYSNPPFNIASQLIVESIKNNNVRNAVVSLQYEVARKLLAKPGDRDYGRITVITRIFFNVEWRGIIPRSWFWPMPKVDAALVSLSRVKTWDWRGELLEDLLRCMFSSKNKLASKVASNCLEALGCRDASMNWLGSKRVRSLTLHDIEEILGVAVECIG